MIALLDVNVLVALFDPEHVHHFVSHDWFADNPDQVWSSCAITENGALRVLARRRRDLRVPLGELMGLLRQFRERSRHQFWAHDLSLLDPEFVDAAHIRGHQQLTDVYLLSLAVKHRGRLVTFDGGVPLAAVKGARPENLVVLAPSE